MDPTGLDHDEDGLPPTDGGGTLLRADAAALQALARVAEPVWLYDFDRQRVAWANPAGLRLWQAENLAELRARPLGADMSPAVDKRLRQYQRDLEQEPGRSFTEIWTLHPKGQPTTLQIEISAIELGDGRIAGLCQGRQAPPLDLEALRSEIGRAHV